VQQAELMMTSQGSARRRSVRAGRAAAVWKVQEDEVRFLPPNCASLRGPHLQPDAQPLEPATLNPLQGLLLAKLDKSTRPTM